MGPLPRIPSWTHSCSRIQGKEILRSYGVAGEALPSPVLGCPRDGRGAKTRGLQSRKRARRCKGSAKPLSPVALIESYLIYPKQFCQQLAKFTAAKIRCRRRKTSRRARSVPPLAGGKCGPLPAAEHATSRTCHRAARQECWGSLSAGPCAPHMVCTCVRGGAAGPARRSPRVYVGVGVRVWV